ncbi:glycosyltransferase family 9 protein [Flavobacterium beibuense]|uniref:glycosyltransferase family 9 protein n=1 Tax=Flavobacterium beibuense TaxID=657326 RepID=UPI0012FAFC5F|nr:glycosyltransferase family 9 protein [Flavobacterium beibuense]
MKIDENLMDAQETQNKKIKMNPRKIIRTATRGVARYLTAGFNNKSGKGISNNDDIKTILICRPNHRLGNLLLLLPLIQELESTFPNSEIDLLVNQSCAIQLYKNYDTVKEVIELPRKPFRNPIKYIRTLLRLRSRKYDLAISAVEECFYGRVCTGISNAKIKFVGDMDSGVKERHIAKQVIYSLRFFLSNIGVKSNVSTPDSLDLRLSNDELIHGGNMVYNITQNGLPTICLYMHATCAKYPTEGWWLDLYEHLQKAFPDVNIIEVLPKENVSKFDLRAPALYSTDIREMAAIIASTDVFIGTDSGLMHLASSSLTPTIGLFSDTDTEKYKPYNEGSVAVKTNEVEIDELIVLVKNNLYPDLNTSL